VSRRSREDNSDLTRIDNTTDAYLWVDEKLVEQFFEKTQADENEEKTVLLKIPEVQAASSYTLESTMEVFSSQETQNNILVTTPLGNIGLPVNMLTGMESITGEKVSITIGQGDKNSLPDDVKETIGDHPLVRITLSVGGRQINWHSHDTPVKISIPYTPTAEELTNPEHIVIWYIDGGDNVVQVPSSRYDQATGTVTFTTTHFSYYAIAYVVKTFGDLKSVSWAKQPIEVLASKGILEGTSETEFAPQANITRADFLCYLVRTLGVDAKLEGNFDDINSDEYYYKEIGIAKKLGITTGTGNNRFSPDAGITRQDMMVLTERALRLLNRLKRQALVSGLDEFADRALISDYAAESVAAVVKEGLIVGSGDNINPLGNATRAEVAMFLYRIYNNY